MNKKTGGDPSVDCTTPKEEIDICLNCPFAEPRCESRKCPLRAMRGHKKNQKKGVMKWYTS